MPRTVVFIASSFPHPVSEFLAENGYNVLESNSAEEALVLSNAQDVDAVIIADCGPYPGIGFGGRTGGLLPDELFSALALQLGPTSTLTERAAQVVFDPQETSDNPSQIVCW
ncbi:MAG: hypothetical protein WA532_14960 [Candidatus Korobacteraceae bacterium]